jgi:hypothetical protein
MNKLEIVDEIIDAARAICENINGKDLISISQWAGEINGLCFALKNELEQEEKNNEHAGCKVFMRWCSTHKREVSECEKLDKSIMKEIREMRKKENVTRGTECVFEERCGNICHPEMCYSRYPIICLTMKFCTTHNKFDCKGNENE